MAATDVAAAWYKWFYENSSFGPADGDVRHLMSKRFEESTGLTIPEEIKEAF